MPLYVARFIGYKQKAPATMAGASNLPGCSASAVAPFADAFVCARAHARVLFKVVIAHDHEHVK